MTEDKKKEAQERQDKITILNYFKDSKKKVHLKIIAGEDAGRFRNGLILSVREPRVLLIDDVIGACNYSVDEIDSNIQEFRERGI